MSRVMVGWTNAISLIQISSDHFEVQEFGFPVKMEVIPTPVKWYLNTFPRCDVNPQVLCVCTFRILKKWKLVSILVCVVLQVLWGFMWQSKDNVIVRKKPSAVVLLKHIFSPFVGSNPRIGFQCKISKFHNTIIIPSCVIFQSMFLFLEILKPSLSYSYCKPCSICLDQAWQGGQKKLLSSNWPAAFFSRQEHRKRPQLNFSKLNWIGINSATLIS